VGALGHYLETEGIPTTQVSLVREHTEALQPPRALWVPFVLGRPFGVPGDAAFQTRVLQAALRLLERSEGPVLEDFPEEAPLIDAAEDLGDLVCPVSFPRLVSEGTLIEQLMDEVEQLGAWHEVAVKHRGRTTLGVTGLAVRDLAAYLGSWLEPAGAPSFRGDLRPADALRLACEELRTFYSEAKSVQPGSRSGADVQRWFWLETAAGRAIKGIRAQVGRSSDDAVKALAESGLVPRSVDRDQG
jgi:hypothetical protein